LEGFTALMAKKMKIIVCLLGNIGKTLLKQYFGRISYKYIGIDYRYWNMEKLKKNCK